MIFAVYGETKTYVTKDYVDSIIQNTYYLFTASSQFSEMESNHKNAIRDAKKVHKHLLDIAINDQNSKYVNWKAEELQRFIILEESEIDSKKKTAQQKMINKLIASFNRLTGKKQPDFNKLNKIYENLIAFDYEKAIEIHDLINIRAENISKEMQFHIQRAFEDKKYLRMSDYLSYVQQNSSFLLIPNVFVDKYSNYSEQIEHLDKGIATLYAQIDKAKEHVLLTELKPTRDLLTYMNTQLEQLLPFISTNDCNYVKRNIKEIERKIYRIEDSLIHIAWHYINAKQSEEAIDFCVILKKSTVTFDKIAKIENAILLIPGDNDMEDNADVEKQIADISKQEPVNSLLSYAAMENKAKHNIDSLRNYAQAQIVQVEKIKKLQKNRAKAKLYTNRLYNLLDKYEIKKAHTKFLEIRTPLEKYSDPVMFSQLERIILSKFELWQSRLAQSN